MKRTISTGDMQTVIEAVELATKINVDYDLRLYVEIELNGDDDCKAYAEGNAIDIECLFAKAIMCI